MEPRLNERGKRADVESRQGAGFNGATLSRAWKLEGRIPSRDPPASMSHAQPSVETSLREKLRKG